MLKLMKYKIWHQFLAPAFNERDSRIDNCSARMSAVFHVCDFFIGKLGLAKHHKPIDKSNETKWLLTIIGVL